MTKASVAASAAWAISAGCILTCAAASPSRVPNSVQSSASPASAARRPPAPPPEEVPPPQKNKSVRVCVGCDQPFDADTHQELLTNLAKSPYLKELRRAQYYQDTVHQFESKAHFDNCDLDEAEAYLTELLADVLAHARAAEAAKAKGDKAAMEAEVKAAFFSLGQALHGTQDFYAHTNYVELVAPKASRVTDLELITPWSQPGRDRISQLRSQGLISGFVFWGFPQKCPSGSTSHANLAKDSQDMKSGKIALPNLANLSQYKVAVFLARETSLKLLEYAFKTSPILCEVNGKDVLFDVLVDRRAADAE